MIFLRALIGSDEPIITLVLWFLPTLSGPTDAFSTEPYLGEYIEVLSFLDLIILHCFNSLELLRLISFQLWSQSSLSPL